VVRKLLGPLSLATATAADHKARRRWWDQLFRRVCSQRYSPAIVAGFGR